MKKLTKELLEDESVIQLFEKDPIVKALLDIRKNNPTYQLSTFKLVGGAVLDILNRRIPKDYDFLSNLGKLAICLLELGATKEYETSTAVTYTFKDRKIQILKRDIEEFDFTINKATFLISGTPKLLNVDLVSYNSKTLYPSSFKPKKAYNSLLRLPIMWDKGYTIASETYLSLLRAARQKNKANKQTGS